jgi:hypothetical protein
MTKRTALAIMRTQPLHRGHTRIVERMITNYSTVIIGLGSADKSRTPSNPFTIDERIEMWDNVFGTRVKLVPLKDLGATRDTNEWCDYVLKKIKGLGLPDPTDYFTGSPADAIWYRGRFFNAQCGSPADDDKDEFIKRYIPNGVFRMLHIEERTQNYIPSATELRNYLVTRSDGWKEWVPAVNHSLIEASFPEDFRVGLDD